jgi:hypothetical protein
MWDAFNEQEPQAQHKQTSHASSSQRSKPSTLKEDNDISLLKRAPTTKKSGKSQRKADSAASSSTVSSDNVDLAQVLMSKVVDGIWKRAMSKFPVEDLPRLQFFVRSMPHSFIKHGPVFTPLFPSASRQAKLNTRPDRSL